MVVGSKASSGQAFGCSWVMNTQKQWPKIFCAYPIVAYFILKKSTSFSLLLGWKFYCTVYIRSDWLVMCKWLRKVTKYAFLDKSWQKVLKKCLPKHSTISIGLFKWVPNDFENITDVQLRIEFLIKHSVHSRTIISQYGGKLVFSWLFRTLRSR